METKVKWLRSEEITPALLKKFGGVITERAFTPTAVRGFFVGRSRAASISAKFIEKLSGKREFADPFGNRVQLPFVTYEMVQFRLSAEFPQIELLNVARSPKRLFLFLSEITGESFAAAPLQIDVAAWIKSIGALLGKVTISEVDYCDVSVTPNLAADISFYGTRSVVDDAQEFLGKRTTAISRAKISVSLDGRPVSLELSRVGGFKASTEVEPRVLDALRGTIALLGETNKASGTAQR